MLLEAMIELLAGLLLVANDELFEADTLGLADEDALAEDLTILLLILTELDFGATLVALIELAFALLGLTEGVSPSQRPNAF